MFKQLFSLVVLSLLATSLVGQDRHVSCHHTKKNIRPETLSEKQKEELYRNVLRSDTFDILHYDLHLDVTDYDGEHLVGNAIITYSPKEADVNSITFDLRGLDVDSVTMNDMPLTYSHIGYNLVVNLPSPTVVGEEGSISIWYQGTPYIDPSWGGFYFQSNYIYNLGIGLSTIPPNFGKVWYPCFDTYVERATYDFYVTSDDGWKAYCQGEFIEEITLGEDTVMRHFSMDQEIPTYLSAVAISDYITHEYVHTGAYGDIDVRLTSKPGNQDQLLNKFSGLGNTIDALEYWFGQEYWGTVGYVMTVVGAMEHPTNIAYPVSVLTGSDQANIDLYSHELGHHWWGDMVSQANYNHMWIKEGPAEYSTHLVSEWNGGQEAYIKAVKDNHEEVMEAAHLDDDGFQVLSPIPDPYIYGTHSYNKGASVMHTLRTYMGDSLFRIGTRAILDSLLNGVMDPESFKAIASEETGVDLEDFFDDWIYKSGFASFEINDVTMIEDNGVYSHTMEIEQKLRECPSFYNNVPLLVSCYDENLVRMDFNFMVGGEISSVEFDTDFEPIMYFLNGDNDINIAKLDHEEVITEPTNTLTLPYVDFKIKVEEIIDPGMVRVEHQWVAADQSNMADNIDQVSAKHYWTVNGNWDENTKVSGRVTYHGSFDGFLDFDLYNDTEEGGLLAYRADPTQPWIEHPYYTPSQGSLTNGNGSFKIDSLIRGEYAFAKGNPTVGLNEININDLQVEVSPNPADDFIRINFNNESMRSEFGNLTLLDVNGRVVYNWSGLNWQNQELDISSISTGQYLLNFSNSKGAIIHTEKLVIK